jgi:putative ABC transport system substrate-binding protein
MRQLIPGLERIAYLLNPTSPFYVGAAEDYQALARRFGLRALMVNASKAEELEPAFREMVAFRAQALVVMGDAFLSGLTNEIGALSASNRLPSIWSFGPPARARGVLIGYGANTEGYERQVAGYVDKIFQGAKPEDLPIVEPIKYDFVINRTTADLLKIKIPPPLLLQATSVVE